jgi:hypothetical protein
MAANRISQVNLDFDAEVILGDLQAGVDLSQFWRQDELDELLADLQPKNIEPAITETAYREQYGVIVICQDEAEQEAVYNQLSAEGLTCKVVVT